MSGILRFAGKVGIVGGAIYSTSSLGVWGDSSQSEKAYKDIYSFVSPYIQEIPVEVPELPRWTDMTSALTNYWNKGVLATGRFLLDLPDTSSAFIKEAYNTISNQINTTNPTESS